MISVEELTQKNARLEAEIIQFKAENIQFKNQNDSLAVKVRELAAQVKWFQNQLFGQKSERRIIEVPKEQLFLDEQFKTEIAEEEIRIVKEHKRKKKTRIKDGDNQELFFDESIVPVEEIEVPNPEIKGLAEDEYEIIGQKTTCKLAQRPGIFVVLKYLRNVIKIKNNDTGDRQISCPSLPAQVFEKSHADVSFLAGLIIDKFQYHLPLHRQHQRLLSSGINVSRPWLTQLVHRCGNLLEPIYYALVDSIRKTRVKLIDETPIKAGRKKKGKMQKAYFWPVLGDDEIVFMYFNSREHHHVVEALGENPDQDSVIVSDGYGAYKAYAEKTNTLNAQCWAHSRREFINAEETEPEKVREALDIIRKIFKIEAEIKKQKLKEDQKLIYRVIHAKPVVDEFFTWVSRQQKEKSLLPGNRLSQALNYVSKREEALSLFLTDPDVPIDTNELERNLRVIPMGRKNWMFCWSEVGAKYVGYFQSLIVTCKMHGIDPYTYLVDVLQRIDDHPASEISKLTPKNWKRNFADNPLCSAIDNPTL